MLTPSVFLIPMEERVAGEDFRLYRTIRDLRAARRACAEEQAELVHFQVDIYPLRRVHGIAAYGAPMRRG